MMLGLAYDEVSKKPKEAAAEDDLHTGKLRTQRKRMKCLMPRLALVWTRIVF